MSKEKVHDAQHPSSDLGLVLPSDTCRLLFRTAQNFIYQQNSQNPPYECEFQALAPTFHHLIKQTTKQDDKFNAKSYLL